MLQNNDQRKELFSPIHHLIGGDTTKEKASFFKRKAYPYWCIEYIKKGAGYLIVDKQRYSLKTNDIYILPKGENHEYGPDTQNPWEKIYIVIDGPLIEGLAKTYGIQHTYHFENQPQTKPLFEKMLLVLKQETDVREQIALLIHEVIIHLANQSKKGYEIKSGLPARIKHYIDGSLNQSLTLEILSNEFHMTKAHLVRVFKQQYQVSPYDYFLMRKFDLACFYLTETEFQLKQIAEKLNFRDEYYFSRFFVQRSKIPPGKYRKQKKEIFSEKLKAPNHRD